MNPAALELLEPYVDTHNPPAKNHASLNDHEALWLFVTKEQRLLLGNYVIMAHIYDKINSMMALRAKLLRHWTLQNDASFEPKGAPISSILSTESLRLRIKKLHDFDRQFQEMFGEMKADRDRVEESLE